MVRVLSLNHMEMPVSTNMSIPWGSAMTANARGNTPTTGDDMESQHGTPILITASDIPDHPLCCQRAHEQGYRRGYRDGYTNAVWDVARTVCFADHIWDQVEAFLQTRLLPWVRRAHQPARLRRRKGGPRLSLITRHTKQFVG